MKKALTLIIATLLLGSIEARGQQKANIDFLYKKINDGIYYSYYNPKYMDRPLNTVTFFKIDIDKRGEVSGISFSDSADSVFVKAYFERQKMYNTMPYIQQFVKQGGYREVALLIPVSFEAVKPLDTAFKNPEKLMRFSKRDFTGKAIIFPVLNIKISDHEM